MAEVILGITKVEHNSNGSFDKTTKQLKKDIWWRKLRHEWHKFEESVLKKNEISEPTKFRKQKPNHLPLETQWNYVFVGFSFFNFVVETVDITFCGSFFLKDLSHPQGFLADFLLSRLSFLWRILFQIYFSSLSRYTELRRRIIQRMESLKVRL